eukprot:CAMPEP_0174370236 /NCGR_PEP_ID=MMETSP0811_2-20130205/95425_1 /TAXON_ID=73025 ORGANISM="Eutreptiella gymnastica-like, Strain CCMP1594" /NCGR_SAMPLE_ID=MMETSP0811_2 /ASSEMBLY_ACC=CAM_ASM_000667 /LENGTH=89 /DNA_ID=CAMNT_0015515447 /DNA_START=386 /DNA_END=655 /DNA_ORIENTATION=+
MAPSAMSKPQLNTIPPSATRHPTSRRVDSAQPCGLWTERTSNGATTTADINLQNSTDSYPSPLLQRGHQRRQAKTGWSCVTCVNPAGLH